MSRHLHTLLCCGLNLVVARLRTLDRRWRWALYTAILLNEIRGVAVVWQFGSTALAAVR